MPRLALAFLIGVLAGCADVLGLDTFATTSAGGAPLTGGAAGGPGEAAGSGGESGGAGAAGGAGAGQGGAGGEAGSSGRSGQGGAGSEAGGQGGAGGDGSCADGQLACAGSCRPSDEHNCGKCDEVCQRGEYCEQGQCAPLTIDQLVVSDLCSCVRYSGGQVLCWGDRFCHGRCRS